VWANWDAVAAEADCGSTKVVPSFLVLSGSGRGGRAWFLSFQLVGSPFEWAIDDLTLAEAAR